MSRQRSRAARWLKMGGASALATLLLVLAALLPVRTSPARAQRPEAIALIMATTTGITDIPGELVRSAFQGLRVQYKGFDLVPFNLPNKTPVRERMDRALLGLEPGAVGRFWVDQKIRDGRAAPRTVPTIDLLVRVVSQLRGAIAGVPVGQVAVGTRALRIDGRNPGESGYLLADK